MILSGGWGWNQNVLIVGSEIIAVKHIKLIRPERSDLQFLSASSGFWNMWNIKFLALLLVFIWFYINFLLICLFCFKFKSLSFQVFFVLNIIPLKYVYFLFRFQVCISGKSRSSHFRSDSLQQSAQLCTCQPGSLTLVLNIGKDITI